MQEYAEANASFYDYCFTGLEGDEKYYVEEARKAETPVLEIGCGTGRILLPIAQCGVSVVGLDRSSAMLEILRNKLGKLDSDTQGRVG